MAENEAAQTSEPSIEANGQIYKLSELSDKARANVESYRFAESEVKRLQRELAVAQTAVAAYRRALIENLPESAGGATTENS